METILTQVHREIEKGIERSINNDDYYGIWKQLSLLKEVKERVHLCKTEKC